MFKELWIVDIIVAWFVERDQAAESETRIIHDNEKDCMILHTHALIKNFKSFEHESAYLFLLIGFSW